MIKINSSNFLKKIYLKNYRSDRLYEDSPSKKFVRSSILDCVSCSISGDLLSLIVLAAEFVLMKTIFVIIDYLSMKVAQLAA